MLPRRELSLFDSVCIIVGIIIGAGIYETAPTVASCMGGPAGALAIWAVGGALALSGALCYAELATAYPREGGDYVYLTRAYGRLPGYLFGWSQLAIVRPGDIALMAFVFARYATRLWAPGAAEANLSLWAALIVVVLTAVNVLGVKSGKWTQNVLTVAKTLGLLAIVCAGFLAPGHVAPAAVEAGQAATEDMGLNLKLALILVLFTYGGWNEMAYVAAEVKDPRRNIVRALALGAVTVTVLYVLVNGAFIRALGYQGTAQSKAIGADAIGAVADKDAAARIIAVLICVSAAGAVNGLIFTGARITYALGAEHAIFRPLGRWNARAGVPLAALIAQGAISLVIVLFAGSFVNAIVYTAPVVWLFFLGTALSLFVLRRREPGVERPYRVLLYPVVPLVFCACCLFMLHGSLTYAWSVRPAALAVVTGVLVLGAPLYAVSQRFEARRRARADAADAARGNNRHPDGGNPL